MFEPGFNTPFSQIRLLNVISSCWEGMQRTGRLSERVTHALQGDSEEDEHRDMEAKKSDSMQETSVRIARLAVMSSRGRGEKDGKCCVDSG